MKKQLTLLVFGFAMNQAMAQLPDGSIAPDWTFTDIQNVSHTLYSDLNAGKAVVMDVSTTW